MIYRFYFAAFFCEALCNVEMKEDCSINKDYYSIVIIIRAGNSPCQETHDKNKTKQKQTEMKRKMRKEVEKEREMV